MSNQGLNLTAEAERLLLDTPRVDIPDVAGHGSVTYSAPSTAGAATDRATTANTADTSGATVHTTTSSAATTETAAEHAAAMPAVMDMDDEDEIRIVFVSANSTPFSPSRVKKEPSTPSAKITSLSPLVRALPTMSTPVTATSQHLDIPMIDIGVITPATRTEEAMQPPPVPTRNTVAVAKTNNQPPAGTSVTTATPVPVVTAAATTVVLEQAPGRTTASTAAAGARINNALQVTSAAAAPPLVDLTTATPPAAAVTNNPQPAAGSAAPATRVQQRARARPRGNASRPRVRGRFTATHRNGYRHTTIRNDTPEVVRLSHSVQREAGASGIVIPEIAIRDFFNYWHRQTEMFYRN